MSEEVSLPGNFSKDEWIIYFQGMLSKVNQSYAQLQDDIADISSDNPGANNLEIAIFDEPSWKGASKIIISKDGQDSFFKVEKNSEGYEIFKDATGLYDYLDSLHYHFNGDHFVSYCTENFREGVETIVDSIFYSKKKKIKNSISKI